MSKYSSRKAVEKINEECVAFDSIVERDRWRYLSLLVRAGEISELELQPSYELQAGYVRNGKKVRAEHYRADFRYMRNGEIVVEDVKGLRLPLYLSKLKRLLYLYPEINFIEVECKQKQWREIKK
jgi:hypothetical protein